MWESFITPGIVLIVSIIFYIIPPKNINGFYGYRTSTSRKSIEAWREGNRYSAILMIKYSLLTIVINVITLLILNFTNQELEIAAFISSMVTVILLLVVIIKTEIHLKRMFK